MKFWAPSPLFGGWQVEKQEIFKKLELHYVKNKKRDAAPEQVSVYFSSLPGEGEPCQRMLDMVPREPQRQQAQPHVR